MPIAGVPHPDDRPRRPRRSAVSQMRPPVVGVLGGVVQQVADHLGQPGRVGVEPAPARPAATTVSSCRGRRSAGGPSPRPGPPPRPASTRSLRSSILPLVIRRHVEQVVDQPDHVLHLPLHHLPGPLAHGRRPRRPAAGPAGRCGSGRAGCAARGPAWRGTRPSCRSCVACSSCSICLPLGHVAGGPGHRLDLAVRPETGTKM